MNETEKERLEPGLPSEEALTQALHDVMHFTLHRIDRMKLPPGFLPCDLTMERSYARLLRAAIVAHTRQKGGVKG